MKSSVKSFLNMHVLYVKKDNPVKLFGVSPATSATKMGIK